MTSRHTHRLSPRIARPRNQQQIFLTESTDSSDSFQHVTEPPKDGPAALRGGNGDKHTLPELSQPSPPRERQCQMHECPRNGEQLRPLFSVMTYSHHSFYHSHLQQVIVFVPSVTDTSVSSVMAKIVHPYSVNLAVSMKILMSTKLISVSKMETQHTQQELHASTHFKKFPRFNGLTSPAQMWFESVTTDTYPSLTSKCIHHDSIVIKLGQLFDRKTSCPPMDSSTWTNILTLGLKPFRHFSLQGITQTMTSGTYITTTQHGRVSVKLSGQRSNSGVST